MRTVLFGASLLAAPTLRAQAPAFSWVRGEAGYFFQNKSSGMKNDAALGLGVGHWYDTRWGAEMTYVHSSLESSTGEWRAGEDHQDISILYCPFRGWGGLVPFIRGGFGASYLQSPLSLTPQNTTRFNFISGVGAQVLLRRQNLGTVELRLVTVESSTRRQEMQLMVGYGLRLSVHPVPKAAAPAPPPLPLQAEPPPPPPEPPKAKAPEPAPVAAPEPASARAPLSKKIVLDEAVLHAPLQTEPLPVPSEPPKAETPEPAPMAAPKPAPTHAPLSKKIVLDEAAQYAPLQAEPLPAPPEPPKAEAPEPAPMAAPKPAPARAPLPKKIVLGEAVLHFPNNGYALGEDAIKAIRSVVEGLKTYPGGYGLMVSGHTSSIGPAAYNEALSLRRAQSVAKAIKEAGIPSARISVAGFGSSQPVAENKTREGQSKNRRAEIHVKTADAVEKIRTDISLVDTPPAKPAKAKLKSKLAKPRPGS